MNAVEISNLTKRFGKVVAVNSVSLAIKRGEVFGLLGPNGAGKTTILSILSTLLRPTSGRAMVNGFDTQKNPDNVRAAIGVVFQEVVLDEDLSAEDNLDFHARLYHLPANLRKQRVREAFALVGLLQHAKRRVKTFSGGMKRRLETARGLLHSPALLFLDEPTLGLDPQARRNIWNYIMELKKIGQITVILTTHYLEEADSLCDRIAIIDNGRIVAVGSPQELKSKIKGDVIKIRISNHKPSLKLLKNIKGVAKVAIDGQEITLTASKAETALIAVIAALKRNGAKLESLAVHKPSLDDVFLHYTGKVLRDES